MNIESGADFSACRLWRYSLWRRWDVQPLLRENERPMAVFIGLNPSTADERENDPTIRRCLGYAAAWDCGGIVMLNLFAWRATDPKEMKRATEPIGADNNAAIERYTADAARIVCCWGKGGTHRGRDQKVLELLKDRKLLCFGVNKDGTPKHPLYLRSDATLREFPAGGADA